MIRSEQHRLSSRITLVAAVVAAILAAGMHASTARADGDPASDYLLGQQIFFPYDTTFPAKQQSDLSGLVEAANRAGFKIRVALIASSYDMGSVTALYGRPRVYARFLGEELSFVYKQRLLIVMPNGLGFSWKNHPSAAAYALLAGIPVSPGAGGLLTAAQTAVKRLAVADGVKVATLRHSTTPEHRHSHDRLIIIAAVAATILLAATARFALGRRREVREQRIRQPGQ